MSADDIVWGRGGGHRVAKGVKAGEGLADIDRLRQEAGGSFHAEEPAKCDGQLSLFDDPPPPAA